jgi:MoxR-like ATPase
MIEPKQILDRMETVIVGKRPVLELVLAAMLADGHVLIEDVPGVAKTMVARVLARTFDLEFGRVQMTPDLLPADLTGTGVWDEHEKTFIFRPGPIFTQILLVDEINRATPRTQAGLLEAMEERAVSAEGQRHRLAPPFFVIATQNPVEQLGVFPLPEAQLDRFLIRIGMGYPEFVDEMRIVEAQVKAHPLESLAPLATLEDLNHMRARATALHTDPSVMDYLVRMVRATRQREDVLLGASPRASLGLHRMARALASIHGAGFVRPDHVKQAAPAVMRHRIILTPQARLAGMTTDQVIEAILNNTEAPLHLGR